MFVEIEAGDHISGSAIDGKKSMRFSFAMSKLACIAPCDCSALSCNPNPSSGLAFASFGGCPG